MSQKFPKKFEKSASIYHFPAQNASLNKCLNRKISRKMTIFVNFYIASARA